MRKNHGGGGGDAEAEGYLFHRAKLQEISCSTGGAGRGEYTMTSITY